MSILGGGSGEGSGVVVDCGGVVSCVGGGFHGEGCVAREMANWP